MVTLGLLAARREPASLQLVFPRPAADDGRPAGVVARLALLSALTCSLAACGGPDGTRDPLGGVPPTGPVVAGPPTVPAVVGPRVTAVEPAVGATSGGTPTFIIGTGFQTGTRVTLGGVALVSELRGGGAVVRGTLLYVETPAHAAGAVDLVVTNPDGQTAVLAGAYTYAPPASFAVDGVWEGWDTAGIHNQVAFTIRDGALTSFTCEGAAVPLSVPLPVRDGAFANGAASAGLAGGATVAGRIVAAASFVGTVSVGNCRNMAWHAERQLPPG
jgi:hypothetical protein